MDYKEKYEMALEKAREWYNKTEPDSYTCIVESIFPELKESEDEKIRKDIVNYFTEGIEFLSLCSFGRDKILAWLEKQYEKKSTDNLTQQEAMDIAVAKCFNEQKAVDKVEPKFYKGEWLCENEPNNYARFIQILEIVNVQGKERYRISRDLHNDEDIVECRFVEDNWHPFNIQDAKPGDVIYLPNGNIEYYLFIFKGIENVAVMSFAHFYQYDDGTSKVEGTTDNLSSVNDVFQPATKEQRELLEKTMAKAGYKWNSEEKRIMKVPKLKEPEGALKQLLNDENEVQNTSTISHYAAWNEEDENILKNLTTILW